MTELVLHHYPMSPFAEKVRVALGIKRLSWRSVIVPKIMPKPDLMPLTGGYRKTPVLQIGADIYCDTQCILRELDRRFPEPSFHRGTDAGLASALAFGADRHLFNPALTVVFVARENVATPEFLADRSKMVGYELQPESFRAAVPFALDQLRAQLGWYESMLSDGRPFLLGDHPTLVDLAVYSPCWFIDRNLGTDTAPLAELPKLTTWLRRVESIGHGQPVDCTSQEALERAKAATPCTPIKTDWNDPLGRRPGLKVQVTPDDTGRDPVIGELIASDAQEIVIRRADPQVGAIDVHFPRAGFVVREPDTGR